MSGEGSVTANAGAPATFLVRLRDSIGNLITEAAEYLSADIAAQLVPVGVSDVEGPFAASLHFSVADTAVIGVYQASVPGPHILLLSFNQTAVAGNLYVNQAIRRRSEALDKRPFVRVCKYV